MAKKEYSPIEDARRGTQFSDLIGHERLIEQLERMIGEGRLPHALLFHGPTNIGKRSLAYALTRRLETAPPDAPGAAEHNERVERKLARGSWYDLAEVRPSDSGMRTIKIDEMREAAEIVWQSPIEGRHRVLIVHDADRMQMESANAFLKLLEEPPAHLKLILTTSQLDQLLPTIRSRCSPLRFSPVPVERLAEWLQRQAGGDQLRNETIAQLSGGRPGLALEMAQSDNLARRQDLLMALCEFEEHGYPRLFKTAIEIKNQIGDDLREGLDVMASWRRDLLVAGLLPGRCDDLLQNRDMAQRLRKDGSKRSRAALLAMLEKTLARYEWTGRMVTTQLALENLLLEIGVASKQTD